MEYPLFCGGENCGRLRVEEMGIRVLLQAESGYRSGILRAYAVGRQGRALIGVMEPKEGRLRVSRVISRAAFSTLGDMTHGEVDAGPGTGEWRQVERLNAFFRTPYWRRNWQEPSGALWREEGGRRYLALPYDPARPFPLTEIFCFARIQQIRQRRYAVFLFDARDLPVAF